MKQETKDRILDVALQLCQKQSFWALKIDDIVRHSHISRATFYNYFKSKDDLIFTLFENELDKIQQDIMSAVNLKDDIRESLKNYLLHSLLSMMEFAQTLNIHLEEIQVLPSIPKKKMDAKKEKDIRIVKDILKRGVDSGDFFIDDLDLTSHMTWIIMTEIGRTAIVENRDAEQVETDINTFLSVLFYGITGASKEQQKRKHYHSQTDSREAHLSYDSGTD
ncbi:MAG: TetR/AcrR family transcriptional regulator [Deltaproteobacteria bacterium]|nr:TetR/AcrR family transcriptional regulator [Candidatus Zymogenaceae bacterium]